MSHPRSHLGIIVALIALISLIPGVGFAQRTVDADSIVRRSGFHSSAHAARNYWTAGRMRAARPAPLPELGHVSPQQMEGHRKTGGVRSIRPQSSNEAHGSAHSTGPGSTEVPTDPTSLDFTTSGRVFFLDSAGTGYSCSGTALNAANLSVVWTAGHCIHGGPKGGWARNWIFVPGYQRGSAPFGEWPALEAFAPRGWTERAAFSHDFAAVVVAAASDGSRLATVTGGRGIRWNVSRNQTFRAFGYPAAPPFDGSTMRMCESRHRGDGPGSPAMVTIGCDMTQGSSGGGWILPNGDLNSNISAGSPDFPNILFGPYLGKAAGEVYTSASTSTKPGPLPDPAATPPSITPPTTTPPSPSPSPLPTELPELQSAVADADDVKGSLDLKSVTVAHRNGRFEAKVTTHGSWNPSQLASGRGALYVDLDTTGAGDADYFAWVFHNGDGLVARIHRYTASKSEPIGNGTVTRAGRTSVTVGLDATLFDIQKTPRWLAGSRFRGRTACERPCFDFAPNRGFTSL